METFIVIITMITGANIYEVTTMIGEFPSDEICEQFTAEVAQGLIDNPKTPWVLSATECVAPHEIIPLSDSGPKGDPT